VVLAFQAPQAQMLRRLDVTALERILSPAPEQPLRFTLASNSAVQVRPFYSLPAGERYFIYLDPRMGTRISHQNVKFTGQWNDAGAHRFSNEVGATAECRFEGSGIRWLGWRYNDAGRAEISIDGQVIGIVDQYGPGRDLPFDWSRRGLAPGPHTIRLRLLPDKPESSSDRYLNVRGFEVLEP
jgi:hypothetical protein